MKKFLVVFKLLFVVLLSQAQFVISGKVTDADGIPLAGASIQVTGTSQGTITNAKGLFELFVKEGEYQINAAFLGFEKSTHTINVVKNQEVLFVLHPTHFMAEEVIVTSTRAGENAKGTAVRVTKEEIANQNLGKDLPFLLSITPSLVATSDAGTGVGYTGFRIRGTDANRINVTVNGIPLNDAESQSVFWVNMPDLASSVESVEIQRGVGTSTNGAAAFGASINMQTNHFKQEPFAEISSAAGSFNTFKNSIGVGSGLIKNHFALEVHLSKISSDGFIDRAFSNLNSYFISGGYHDENTLLKFNIFSGKEKTYQAWNGIPKVRLENDTEGMLRYAEHWLYSNAEVNHMVQSNSRTFNLYTYANETDNYQQDHYQLLFSHQFAMGFILNTALHYTYGRGYYEQYKADDELANYRIPDVITGQDTITSSDIIRQKWLDNDFYGAIASLNYKTQNSSFILGGGINIYDGMHYGEVIWGQYLGSISNNYKWYQSSGLKKDGNLYFKTNLALTETIRIFGDIQYRFIQHDISGIDDDLRNITQNHGFHFFNPKFGMNLKPAKEWEVYAMYANGHREPNRSNFTDANPNLPLPTSESLHNLELGTIYKHQMVNLGGNFYYMRYHNQLVLTGQINDVGSAIMTNVENSYRIGIELSGSVKIGDMANWDLNLTLSRNKIDDFTEYIDNWDTGEQETHQLGKTDIAFSPNVVYNSLLKMYPIQNLTVSLSTQMVGKQFIDNTSSKDRMLEPYFLNDLLITYSIKPTFISEMTINLQINNLLNHEYESNAWVYSYIYEGQRWAMDGYFPQAGINFLAGVTCKF